MNIIAPSVTVFMAAYNASKYIEVAVKSILNQTYQDFELLIVNDGSTDDTSEILKSFKDERIRIINNVENKGLTYTRNIALKEARGQFIAIMDSDDMSYPNRLAIQIDAFNDKPHLALYGGQAKMIDENQKEIGFIEESETNPDLLKVKLLFHNTFVHSSVMIRTSIFREFGGYQEPFAEDYDLFLRIAQKYAVGNSSEFFVAYRWHGSNISRTEGEKIVKQLLPIKGKLLKKIGLKSTISQQKILTNPYLWNDVSIYEYQELFRSLLLYNKQEKTFDDQILEEIIFDKWYDALIHLGGANSAKLFFSKPIFKWRYCTFKKLRKILKKSIKSIIKARK
ncbi:glycosyltransferase [Sphingobacterium sp.]|uniref:glycosyltransferase family 2 protein n=1 Tax=Sphingobacterium sp. TaxID=341027 RepID=UPI0028AA91CD|nr:glycosyltransferase [Sphingobacterium sp.]